MFRTPTAVSLLFLVSACAERLPAPSWDDRTPTPAPVCGDGIVQGNELCDDGNRNDEDSCTNACLEARCGDGIQRVDLTESQPGFEYCDDGNASDTDACLTSCETARCGDGLVHAGVEECDDANPVDSDACLSNCEEATCGDGVVRMGLGQDAEGFESCDDGNSVNNDGCLDCLLATCGDGVLRTDLQPGQPGYEACDDGNTVNEDSCTNACLEAFCGDGITQADVEECDDANANQRDGCTNDCDLATCGDGIQRIDLAENDEGYEGCDDGNGENSDGCLNTCRVARCGDSVIRQDILDGQPGFESCDDGNEDVGDGCNASCQIEVCGNGILDHGEACDDGNQINEDACLNTCIAATCGDQVVRQDILPGQPGYEACDDGNQNNDDACRNDCTAYPDGSEAARAAPNCTLLKRIYPNTGDGHYWIINPNTNQPIRSACDYTTAANDGPWTRCLFRSSANGGIRPANFASCTGWGGRELLIKVYDEAVQEFPEAPATPFTKVRLTAPSAQTLNRYFTLDEERHTWQYQTDRWNLTRLGGNGPYGRTLSLNYRGRLRVLFQTIPWNVEICAGPDAVYIPGNNDHNFIFCISSSGHSLRQGLRRGVTEHDDWAIEIFTHVPAD